MEEPKIKAYGVSHSSKLFGIPTRSLNEIFKEFKKAGIKKAGIELLHPWHTSGTKSRLDGSGRYFLAAFKKAKRAGIELKQLENPIMQTCYVSLRHFAGGKNWNAEIDPDEFAESIPKFLEDRKKKLDAGNDFWKLTSKALRQISSYLRDSPPIKINELGGAMNLLRTKGMLLEANRHNVSHILVGGMHAYHLEKLGLAKAKYYDLENHPNFDDLFKFSGLSYKKLQPLMDKIEKISGEY
ncbi:hypothetical protein HY989_01510 [Candidatus Micrarchaeota archaeon]|nr:hypothetical protein [Candidatus Micrarchaeota archaeon]